MRHRHMSRIVQAQASLRDMHESSLYSRIISVKISPYFAAMQLSIMIFISNRKRSCEHTLAAYVLPIMTVAVVILGATIPALGNEDTLPDTGPIRIGGLFPLTGEISAAGSEIRMATELGIKDFNAYLAENGQDWWLELSVEDTATNPDIALEKIQKLHQTGITSVLGPSTSSNVDGIKEYADTHGMLVLSCCSSAASLAIAGDSIYRLVSDDSGSGYASARLAEHVGIKALVPIWRADTYGDDLQRIISDDFQSTDGIIYGGIRYAPDSSDLTLEVALLNKHVQEAIQMYGIEKVAVLAISFEEFVDITRIAADHDTLGDIRWFASESASLSDVPADEPEAAAFAAMVEFTSTQRKPADGAEYERVTKELSSQLGREPGIISYRAYDAVWILGMSILKADSTDAADIRQALPDVAADYSGALLDTDLNEAGDLLPTGYRIVHIRDGQWTVSDDTTATDVLTPDTEMLIADASGTAMGVGHSGTPTTVSVYGSAETTLDADRLVINLGVSTIKDTAADALAENSILLGRAIEAILSVGVSAEDISTAHISLYPRYGSDWDPETGESISRLIGYEVSNTISVDTAQIDKAADIIDGAVGAGINRVESVSFGVSQERKSETLNGLMSDAMDDAMDKAALILAPLNYHITGIESISAGETDLVQNLFADTGLALAGAFGAPPVFAHDQKISVTVAVKFYAGP